MEDLCVFCGADVTDLGIQYCENCANKRSRNCGTTLCKECGYFIADGHSKIGYCTMKQCRKLNFDTCNYAERIKNE